MKNAKPGEFMSVREVARYLGINEKKVYSLAKTNNIPCTRVTGKWTFPRQLIDRWIEESASRNIARSSNTQDRGVLLGAGSDDPALAVLSDLYGAPGAAASLFMATVGSGAGLESLRSGMVDFATAHLFDPARPAADGRPAEKSLPESTVVIELFYRELGWIVTPGNPKGIESPHDLARPKLRFINRQTGSGTRAYLDQQLLRAKINGKKISGYNETVSTHLEIGLRILSGRCDVGLATRTTAQLLGLEFVPVTRERFDMLVPKERFFTKPMQGLLSLVASRQFRERVAALGGYDVAESGRIVRSN
jgi:excisionase family DNA binding protein